jgi:hypothetical protein
MFLTLGGAVRLVSVVKPCNCGSLIPMVDIVGFLALLSPWSVGFSFRLLCSRNSSMDGDAVIMVLTVFRPLLVRKSRCGQRRKQRFPLLLYPHVAVETWLFAKLLLMFAKLLLSNGCLCWLHSSCLQQTCHNIIVFVSISLLIPYFPFQISSVFVFESKGGNHLE